MTKYYYKKNQKRNIKKIFRFLSLGILILGLAIIFYVFAPLISWQIYFAPVFASQNINYPIPKTTIIGDFQVASLISQAGKSIALDYTNAQNWFPSYNARTGKPNIPSYTLSIKALGIKDAIVSTLDNNLAKHLVNYEGTSVPPNKGNAVVFGHSTLPQLFNPSDYKTIFANAYKMKIGDEIFVNIKGVSYKYKVEKIIIVDPNDTSVLEQNQSDSFLTLITCTPPGTVWKRLVIKARLDKI